MEDLMVVAHLGRLNSSEPILPVLLLGKFPSGRETAISGQDIPVRVVLQP